MNDRDRAVAMPGSIAPAGATRPKRMVAATGRPKARRHANWSIGIMAGLTPVDLAPLPGLANPVLTAADVSDIDAAFLADPFLAFDRGRWWMFFEVMPKYSDDAVIGLAESKDGLAWKYRGVVLQEPFHLSYPYVFTWRGSYYMTPETLAPNCIRLYRATRFPDRWEHTADLLEGRHADPSVFRAGKAWWMFSCTSPGEHRTLRLFRSDRLKGRWFEHPRSPVVAGDARIARPAGRVISWDGSFIRFAQDCYLRYGLQVRAFRITALTAASYEEEPARPAPILVPGERGWNAHGMHHVDPHRRPGGGWFAAVDGYS
jgi:hypothetical protein